MPNFHTLPDYIIRKGCFLSGTLLAASLVLLVWASAHPFTFPILRHFATHSQFSAAVVLASSLLGGVLLEDILRKGEKS